MVKPLAMGLSLLLVSGAALAHKVVGGVYAEGALIEGEIGFSSGKLAKPGTRVEVFDAAGNKLGETQLDADSMFTFTATQLIDHHFRADLSAGHIAQLMLPAEDLEIAGAAAATPNPVSSGSAAAAPVAASASAGISVAAIDQIVRKAVAAKLKPLQRELRASREKTRFMDVLGGIGYIFGLFGLASLLAERRKRQQAG